MRPTIFRVTADMFRIFTREPLDTDLCFSRDYGINVERRTMTDLAVAAVVDTQTGVSSSVSSSRLRNSIQVVSIPSLLNSKRMVEIALFYFRTGYGPTQYIDGEKSIVVVEIDGGLVLIDSHWELRERLEKSNAVMCPSVPQQLTGRRSEATFVC